MILNYNILHFLLLIVITILLTEISRQEVFASSSAVSLQEIKDKQSDWIDIQNNNYTNKGSNYTDIRAVNYFSNGITLNATVWLASPFVDKPHFNVGYGLLIDADFNKQTGLKGFDYQVEISRDNETKNWTKVVREWSSPIDTRILYQKNNFTGFFEKQGRYVALDTALEPLGFPNQYNIMFYAFEKKDNSVSTIDITNRIPIPSPKLSLSIFPSSITLIPGEEKNLQIQINSTANFRSYVILSTNTSLNQGMSLSLSPNETYVPSSGMSTSLLHIKALENATAQPHTLQISGNLTIPPEDSYENVKQNKTINEFNIPSLVKGENTTQISTLKALVLPPLTAAEQLSDILTKYGVITGFLPLIITTLVALKLLKSINLTYFSSIFKHMKVTDLYQINATVIIGVLIFLTLGGSSNVTPSSGMTKPSSLLVGVMTASIVFPFALSVIRVAIKNSVDFGIKLTIAGFVYLMVTVILLAFIL